MSDTLPTTTADAPLLELRGLTKHFPLTQGVLLRRTVGQVQAVDGVSMTLGPGETLGLVGESGSGKSTVAKLIMALQQPNINLFIPISFPVFHAIFFGEPLNLSMTKHRQSGHCDHQDTNSKLFITFPKLFNRSLFIRIIHEIDIAFEDIRVVFKR